MKGENISAVLYGKNDLRVENRPLPPAPGPNEVVVRMSAVGICGTDITMLTKGGFSKDFWVERPVTLGHESAGTVFQVGENVTHLKAGDRVALEPAYPCRYCHSCKIGRYNLCKDLKISGCPHVDGSICRYKTHFADFCYKLPSNVSLEEGALCEPLAVSVHACRRAEVSLGDKVLITGAGPIGLMSLIAARAMGASRVFVTDVNASRLKTAADLGASDTLLIQPSFTEDDIALKVVEAYGGAPDVSLECSARESAVSLAINVTRKGGKVVLVGIGAERMTVPILNAICSQVDILSVFCYDGHCFPAAIALLGSDIAKLSQLITHRFPLERAAEAFDLVKSGSEGVVKVIIQC